ncbi:class F sortase [Streptomyces asoensis]|uniref:class F sortase n=1 Tax=Streptomyces asoensis TaxID=249586 RepID=UPI0019CD937B|nr:class F sortase [Streptomyces asoensis]GGQ65304.1 class F sortase [Streptomyces asoensis]
MASRRTSDPSPSPFIPSARSLAWTLVAGTVLLAGAVHDEQPPQPSAGQALSPLPGASVHRTAAPAGPAVSPLPPAEPLRLRIPAINVNAPVTKLHLDSSGALEPPPSDDPNRAGWYSEGTAPGSAGTAVTAGHVDLPTGNAGVFYGLGALTKGNTIEIDRADRRTAVFTVDALEVYDKERFPSNKVYGISERAELRVITCGGGYAKDTGYQGNLVVYATLTAVR